LAASGFAVIQDLPHFFRLSEIDLFVYMPLSIGRQAWALTKFSPLAAIPNASALDRESQVLAALNHPTSPIYGLSESRDSARWLMELAPAKRSGSMKRGLCL